MNKHLRFAGRLTHRAVLAAFPALFALLALLTISCGSRDGVWDETATISAANGLDGSVVLVDASAERALLLPVEGNLTVSPTSIPIGPGFAVAQATVQQNELLLLMHGDVPFTQATDQTPSLHTVLGGTNPKAGPAYPLSDPLSGLAVDPEGQFAVAYASSADSAFVQNPNELVIVDLTRGPAADNPTPITLRSFGGTPQAFTFTPALALPGGETRLLVVQTDRDVGLLDLAQPSVPNITVQLSTTGEALTPAQVVAIDADPTLGSDARLAIRITDQPNVVLVDMLAVPSGETSPYRFQPTPNLVYVGGTPSDVAFVQTDGGLRLAALVPAEQALTLVDPATGIATSVQLGAPYSAMDLITSVVGAGSDGSDVALLWSSESADVAFVALGSTVGTPYKSVQHLSLASPVSQVIDVPAPNQHLKILVNQDGNGLVVLDLLQRTAAPISTSDGVRVKPADDGLRLWLLPNDTSEIASLALDNLHPTNVPLSYPVMDAFELTRRDGGRALVVVHQIGAGALTVLDGETPTIEDAENYVGVLLDNVPNLEGSSQ